MRAAAALALLAALAAVLLAARVDSTETALAAAFNLLAFCAFGWDKLAASTARTRIPETVLHLLCLAGGAGAALGRLLFRHKTLHTSFTASSGAGVLLLWTLLHLTA